MPAAQPARRAHRAGARELPARRAARPRRAGARLRHGQARLRAHQPRPGRLGRRRRQGRRHRAAPAASSPTACSRHEIVVDRLQGGAGTSTNMNVNEVLANRALQLLGEPPATTPGSRPSTTSTCTRAPTTPTPPPCAWPPSAAARPGGAGGGAAGGLPGQGAGSSRTSSRSARTQYQDAVLTTLGREMGAYAEALNRDRWRIYKCEERLRVVNLGGTAIGTGFAAPRQYIFRVVDTLRELTGIGFARAENLTEATQNADVFVEVSGILKAHASTLLKICGDLRLLSSGPEAGLGEIRLPRRQAGSSIMPGKVNPVIPEAVSQAALLVIGLRRHHRRRRRPGQPGAQRLPAAHRRLPAAEPDAAHRRLRDPAPLLRRGHRGRRGALRGARARLQRRRHGARAARSATTPPATLVAAGPGSSGRAIRDVVCRRRPLSADRVRRAAEPPRRVCRLGTPQAARAAPWIGY